MWPEYVNSGIIIRYQRKPDNRWKMYKKTRSLNSFKGIVTKLAVDVKGWNNYEPGKFQEYNQNKTKDIHETLNPTGCKHLIY